MSIPNAHPSTQIPHIHIPILHAQQPIQLNHSSNHGHTFDDVLQLHPTIKLPVDGRTLQTIDAILAVVGILVVLKLSYARLVSSRCERGSNHGGHAPTALRDNGRRPWRIRMRGELYIAHLDGTAGRDESVHQVVCRQVHQGR